MLPSRFSLCRSLSVFCVHMFVLSSQSNIIESGGAEREDDDEWTGGEFVTQKQFSIHLAAADKKRKRKRKENWNTEDEGEQMMGNRKRKMKIEFPIYFHIFFLFYLSSTAQKKNFHSSSNRNTLEIGIIIIIQLNSIQTVAALTWRRSALKMAPKAHCSSPELSSETVEIILAFPKAPFLLRDTFMFWTVSRCLSFLFSHVR